jgi:hypothetical protein
LLLLGLARKLKHLNVNACKATPQQQLLEEMSHPQPPMLIQTDDITALEAITSNIQPRQTKAMEIRFHWLRCHEAQSQLRFFWWPGTTNLANYWTKHHCATHHIKQRPKILMPQSMITALQASKQRMSAHLLNHKYAAAAA